MKQGRLIVIEGSNSSGKGTQLKLLIDYFKKKGTPVAVFDFPQYEETFFGNFVGRFLTGEFGPVAKINPYLAMFPYAADRWQVKDKMYAALKEGKIVLCNRYAPSVVHQVVKVLPKERVTFLKWASRLEYDVFKIPKEDIVIFLHVPFNISQKLMEQRDKKTYLKGKVKDQHENNTSLLKRVEKMYVWMANYEKKWKTINCTHQGNILSPNDIHMKILAVLQEKKVI